MVIMRLILVGLLVFSAKLNAEDLLPCDYSSNCNDGEVCVSYTSCDGQKNKQQVRNCLTRSCYSLGKNCPESIYCDNRHCGDMRCAKK